MKQCTKCLIEKPITEFNRSKRGKDGYHPRCRKCAKEILDIWHSAHPEKSNEYSFKFRTNNPERRKEIGLAFYYRHHDKNKLDGRNRARQNKEQRAITKRAWQKANPEKVREYTERRRIRKTQNGEYQITEKELKKLYESLCIYCGSNKRITLDHVIPISRGGSHGIGNIAPACLSCNSSKSDKTIMEWRKLEAKSALI